MIDPAKWTSTKIALPPQSAEESTILFYGTKILKIKDSEKCERGSDYKFYGDVPCEIRINFYVLACGYDNDFEYYLYYHHVVISDWALESLCCRDKHRSSTIDGSAHRLLALFDEETLKLNLRDISKWVDLRNLDLT